MLHWGADLGDLDDAALRALAAADVPAVPHSALDVPAPVSLLPQHAEGYAGRAELAGSRDGAGWSALFRTRRLAVEPLDGGGRRVVVEAADEAAGLRLRTELEMVASGVVRMRHAVHSTGGSDYTVEALPVALRVPAQASELLDLTGRWGHERWPQRHPFPYGAWVREQRRGRTGHDAPTVLAAMPAGTGQRSGEVWAVHVAWSGNTSTFAERLPEGWCCVGGGELLGSGEVRLAASDEYVTPWLYAAYSGAGLDGVAQAFHAMVRSRPGHPRTARPVVLNTWEAVYFDHDLDRLRGLADIAAEVAVERFVLDDGWFGGRRHDSAGLGDWVVSEDLWPEGLHPLVDHVTGLGMQFGLWVEPEMVNLDSDLVREHPDWVLAEPHRLPPSWRFQHVLDLARPEAWAHILQRLDALLTEYPIAYLKWDHNRDLHEATHEGRPGVRAQTLAFYRLLDALRERHPAVEIESCASGGGRVDLGVLERTDRVWTSDVTDAVERQDIQRWTGLLLPPELIGAHVSAPRSHQTGRVLDLDFRAGTALFGSFGIEWDLAAASPPERARLAEWVAAYRRFRPLLHGGHSVRSDAPGEGRELYGVVARDLGEAVYAYVRLGTSAASVPPPLRLPGLDPHSTYRVQPLPPGDAPFTTAIGPPRWIADGGVTLPGRVLATSGLAAPLIGPAQLLLLHAEVVPSGA
jgi:alpha-galactosidase